MAKGGLDYCSYIVLRCNKTNEELGTTDLFNPEWSYLTLYTWVSINLSPIWLRNA